MRRRNLGGVRVEWRGLVTGAAIALAIAAVLAVYALLAGRTLREAAITHADAVLAEYVDYRVTVYDRRFRHYETLHGLARMVALTQLTDLAGNDGNARVLHALEEETRASIADPLLMVRALSVSDAEGRVVWSTRGPGVVGMLIGDRSYNQRLLRGEAEVVIGGTDRGRIDPVPAVLYNRVVRDAQGRLLGIATLMVNPATLVELPKGIATGLPIQTAVYDGAGGLLAGSDNLQNAPVITLPAPMRDARQAASADGRRYRIALGRTTVAPMIVAMMVDEAAIDAQVESGLAELHARLRWIWMCFSLAALFLVTIQRMRRDSQEDLRERQSTAAALNRMTELAENLQDMVVIWEDAGTPQSICFTYVSPSSQQMVGYSPEEICADRRKLRFHHEDFPLLMDRLGQLHEVDGTFPVQTYRLIRADGAVVWVEVAANRLRGNLAGPLKRYIGCFRDITDRKRAEEAVASVNRRVERLTINCPLALYELSMRIRPDGGYERLEVYISRSAELQSGYPVKDLETQGFMASITEPNLEQLRGPQVVKALTTGAATVEYVIRCADGRMINVVDTCAITERNGDEVVVTGFALDITEEKKLRAPLLEASKLSFLGEIAAGIAHEMHQPLAAIALQAEMLGLTVPDGSPERERMLNRVEKIGDLVQRTAGVIQRIRAFSRSDPAAAAPFDPLAAITEGMALIDDRVRQSQIEVSMTSPDGPLRVMGQQAPFEQVILNLVTNAIDAYGPANGAVRPVHIAVSRSGEEAAITVADQAGGIGDAALDRLFEPFFTTKPMGAGTGLGLSISYRIIKDMGGRISAENRDGGAVFRIMLPLCRADANA